MKKNKPSSFEKDMEELKNATEKDFKVRVTTYIDADVYRTLRELANKKGIGYQTFLNMFLRENLIEKKEQSLTSDEANKILKEIGKLVKVTKKAKAA